MNMPLNHRSFAQEGSGLATLRRAILLIYPKPLEEFLETRRISRLITKQSVARQAYDEAKKNLNEDDPSARDILKLRKQDVVKLSQEVLALRRLIQVMPDAESEVLHQQLIENEKVHAVNSADELIANRLGAQGMNKDCQALIVPTKFGPKILAGIFRYHATIPEQEGMIDVRHLPGNVDEIKNTPVAELTGEENVTGYWTISSGWDGSGPILVSDLSQVTPEGRLETTISPIRGFTSRNDRDTMMVMNDDAIRARVLDYLLTEKDLVRNFHMGNGAYLAWIHVNRDAPADSEDWITVNYLYNRAELAQNQGMFKAGLLPVSPVLYRMMDHTQIPKAYNVCHQAMVARPGTQALTAS
jgi:hypothetical protein